MRYRDRRGVYHIKPQNKTAKKRTSAYGIIIQNNKILLVKEIGLNRWQLPGGGVDSNESPTEALLREFIEETGFLIKEFDENCIKSIKQNFYADTIDEYFDSTMLFYRITLLGDQNQSLICSDEIQDVQWIDVNELNEHNTNVIHLEIIRIFN